MYSGYICYAYLWAQAAVVADEALSAGSDEKDFYQGKLYSANFYYQRVLPRTEALSKTMMSGVKNLLDKEFDPFTL